MRIISTHKISISFAPILYYQFNCSPIFRRIINRKFVKIHLIIIIFMVLFRWILLSLPTQGAWIEMFHSVLPFFLSCRSLHRERGLKSLWLISGMKEKKSLPTQGAWIEIKHTEDIARNTAVAPYTGSVD